jgi:nucleotide-binding universal stress UspA family protein
MASSILVPYYGSQQSQSTLQYTSELFPEKELTALYPIEPYAPVPNADEQAQKQYAQTYERSQNILSDARTQAADHAETVTTEFVYGHPVHAILRYADLYTFEQITIGRSDQRGRTDDDLSTVVESIVRRAAIPVTVVQSEAGNVPIRPPESILVAFDGSTLSCNALRYAIETFPHAVVHVLYVPYPFVDDIDRPGVRNSEYDSFEEWYDAVLEWHAQADRDPEKILQIADRIAGDTETDVQLIIKAGDPPRTILEYRDQINADHLIIGSHSRDDTTSIVLGTVSQSVVRHSPRPVTIVH